MSFAALNVISTYSLLASTTRIEALVAAAVDRGYEALALTDHNVMYGAVAFYNACQRAGVKPLLGLTLTTQGIAGTAAADWVLLAKDFTGYQHLMQLSTAKMTATADQPLTLDTVAPLLTHLLVINPPDGEVAQLVNAGNRSEATAVLTTLQAWCDPDSVVMGVSLSQSDELLTVLSAVTQPLGVAHVALPAVHYVDAADHFAVDVLRAVDQGAVLTELSERAAQSGQHWLKPAATMVTEFNQRGLADAATMTERVAAACNVTLKFASPQLPQFPTPDQQPSVTYLRQLCDQGLTERLAEMSAPDVAAYRERLTHELTVIHRMGFDDYFLIVEDVMNFAHRAHIQTGPGRGSAAGSLVAYVLRITDVDPLAYHLLFERFLNEERQQMPDIDLDIPDDKREVVLNYVHQKYGHQRVAQIITFGTLAAKQALRDVGRVFGLNPAAQADWSAAVPNQLHVSLKAALQQSQKLQNLVADSPTNALLFQTASQLEGLPRHYSTHAAGIVLSNGPLQEIVPLQAGSDELMMTQYPKDTVEAVGLLKMDFLGLRNLSIMANALRLVTRQTGQPFAIDRIDLNDPATLALFQRGDTNGVFQFESAGIKNVLRQLQPDSFELVAAVNALYRPGPMENIDTFIRRKQGQEAITYPAEALKPILAPTYGILVYQEQVMQVAAVMGGFSLGEADLLRRAMSKKKKATMDAMQRQFITGAQRRGYTKETAQQVFDYIDRFANYGFNRSHAVAYSKMAVELAYLKAHFPGPFYAALLNSVINVPNKTKLYLMEAKQHGVAILPPDINRSGAYFTVTSAGLLFGLSSIKGVRRDFLRALLAERQTHGPFKDLQQFLQRIDAKFRKTDLLTALVYAGAFDQFHANRAELAAALPEFISSVDLSGNNLELFEVLTPKIPHRPELTLAERLEMEDLYLGAYVSGHPVEQYRQLAAKRGAVPVSDFVVQQRVTSLLYVTKIRTIRTKRGQQMAFLTGSDETGDVGITVFPNTYQRVSEWLAPGQVVIVTGKVEENRGLAIVTDRLESAAAQLPSTSARWFVRIDAAHDQTSVYQQLTAALTAESGPVPVILYQPQTNAKRVLPQAQWLPADEQLLPVLTAIVGEGNVVLQQNDN